MPTRFVGCGGVILHYRLLGGGDHTTPVLMLHGFASTGTLNWVESGWVDRLLKCGRSVVLLDQRGHGESEKPRDSRSYDRSAMAADCVELLDYLAIDAADVVGFSMGARIALELLANAPSRCHRAVLIAPGWFEAGEVARDLAQQLASHGSSEGTRDALVEFALSVPGNDPQALASCLLGPHPPVRQRLAAVACDTLVAVGDADPLRQDAEEIATGLPHARLLVVPRLNHLNVIRSSKVQAAAEAFLAEGDSVTAPAATDTAVPSGETPAC